jgi:hypothetical protein
VPGADTPFNLDAADARVVPPSSRDLIGALAGAAGQEALAGRVADTSSSAYGFASAVSKPAGSLQLGVLLADLEMSVRANDRDKVLDACTALAQGLVNLDAGADLVMAVLNLRAAVHNDVPLQSINRASLPLIRPFLESFVSDEGDLLYLRLGEWSESLYLSAKVAQEGSSESLDQLLKTAGLADTFAQQLKARGSVPAGVYTQLDTLAEIGRKTALSPRDYAAAANATERLQALIG